MSRHEIESWHSQSWQEAEGALELLFTASSFVYAIVFHQLERDGGAIGKGYLSNQLAELCKSICGHAILIKSIEPRQWETS
jgi:hypothetical protein